MTKQWKLGTTIGNAPFDELIKHIFKGLDAPIDVIKITPNNRLTGLQGPYKNVESTVILYQSEKYLVSQLVRKGSDKMAVCRRCGVEVNGISSLFTFNKQKGRCKNCEIATQHVLIRFREAFLRLSSDGIFTSEILQYLTIGFYPKRRVGLRKGSQPLR